MNGSADRDRWRIERLDSVGSSQDLLKRRVAAGEDVTGLVVRARQQTGGRGRRGSAWSSPPGGSYQSVGLGFVPRLQDASGPDGAVEEALSRLPLALAIGVAEELGAAGAKVAVKWPNDLILVAAGRRRGADDRWPGRSEAAGAVPEVAGKLGGLLVEVSGGQALAGIGVNVDNAIPDGAAALRGWDVETVSDLVLDGVLAGLSLIRADPDELGGRLTPLDWLRGRLLTVETPDAVINGEAVGVDRRGCLRLRLTSAPPVDDEQPGQSAHPATRLVTVCRGHVLSVA